MVNRVIPFCAFSVIFFLFLVIDSSWARPPKRTINPTFDIQNFNSTQLIKTVREMAKDTGKFRRLATLSLLTGAIKTEERMEMELTKMINDFVETFNDTSLTGQEKKLKEISKFVQRDLRAMFILSSAIDLTHYNASFEEFRNSMREFALNAEQISPRLEKDVLRNNKHPLQTVRDFIDEHIRILRNSLLNRVSDSIAAMKMEDDSKSLFVQPINVQPTASEDKNELPPIPTTESSKRGSKKGGKSKGSRKVAAGIRNIPKNYDELTSASYLPYQEEILQHLKNLDRKRRQNDDDDDTEDFDPNDEQPGGLVGLIASLSGGPEGSDVGAVIGALSGVVAQIFGPGGVDVNSLLSSGTSLIAGLLGGDQNFGKVLATYIGTSIDGFSGGGGADNNGLFVGNLLGGVLGALSADPEDEDVNPIKPGVFLGNVLTGTFQGLAKAPEGESRRDKSDRRDNQDRQMDMEGADHAMGSDVLGFIKGIAKGIIGGVISIVLNSLSGLSNGALKGTMKLSMGTLGPLSDASDGLAALVTT